MNAFFRPAFLLVLLPFLLSEDTPDRYPFPKRVAIERIEVSMPNSTRNEEMPMSLIQDYTESFHPIGWSHDGKAAFLVWGERSNSSEFGVIVYDVAHDSVAGKWFEDMGDNRNLEQDQIEAFWERDRNQIVPLLKKFGILPVADAAYADFPAHFDGAEYSLEYSLHNNKDDEKYYDGIDGSCLVTKDGNVSRKPFSWMNYHDFNVQPAGVWMSPDHQYALTVIVVETPGPLELSHPHNIWYSFRTFWK